MAPINYISYGIWIFCLIWFFGGLVLFYYIHQEGWNHRAKNFVSFTVRTTKRTGRGALDLLFVFGILWIPAAVTALTFFFEP